MKIGHIFVKRFLIILSLCFLMADSVFAIEEKDYKNMTDRDRILLSVSYYEVSMKYEALNNKALANSYRKEAQKIEPNVLKYYSGEWEVPRKTIEIDWNSIFADETGDNQSSQNDTDDDAQDEDEISEDNDDIDDEYLDGLLNGGDLSDDNDIAAADNTDDELTALLGGDGESVPEQAASDDKNEAKQDNETVLPAEKYSEVSPYETDNDRAAKEDDHIPEPDNGSISNDTEWDASDDEGWIPGQTSDADTVIIFSQIVRNFTDGVNIKDPDKAVRDFAETVAIQGSAFNMTKEELRDTVASWTAEHDEPIPDYTDILISDEDDGSYTVKVMFSQDFTFLMPMNNKTMLFRLVRSDSRYLITEVRLAPPQSSESAASNDGQGYMYRFVSMVLSGEYEFVNALLAKDIWIAEFNMLFPASEIIDHLQNWAVDNPDIRDPAEVIDMQSVSYSDDAALAMLQSIGISADDYDIISFTLRNRTFLPGDPSRDNYTVIVSKSGADEGRICSVIQK